MSVLQINLADDVRSAAEARAAEAGYRNVDEYLAALVVADTAAEPVDDDLEALLVQRLTDPRPSVEFTPDFAQQFRADVARRRAAGHRP